MNFSSLLSDHEQKAFSAFLGQLAQEERYKHNSSAPPSTDPALSHQQFQHQMQHRQLLPLLPLSSPPTSFNDPSSGAVQQQRDLIQQISANPLLAPGGTIDPHAMSQAFLQNPELMAQANAITQAMVLAQQQQMQIQLQQQQQQQQQEQAMLNQHDPHHLQSAYQSAHQQSLQRQYQENSPPGQYSPDQQQQYYGRGIYEPTSSPGGPRTITKRKSQTNLHTGDSDDLTPPPLPHNGSVHHPGSGSYSSSPNGYYEAGHVAHENEDEYGRLTKKTTSRKGSSGTESSLPSKSGYRSSRDGYDAHQRNGARRKTSGSSSYDMSGRRTDYHVEKREDSEEISFPGPVAEHRNGLTSSNVSGLMGEKEVSRHRQSSSADSQTSRTRSPPSNQAQSRAKKAPHELLTDAEKKANHIASEQKRRQNIRIGFDSLVEIVPTLSECHRSEALILQKSVDYIHRLLSQKNELKTRVRDLQANLGEPNEDDDSASDMEIEMYH
ncbi:hypothetical protein BGZ54_009005 [Gamsiella multidivaricata]|nr:hypothetical protein BGZ54_009005 [Gamsiella multidivaricata]